MKIVSSYAIRIKNADKIFSQTIRIYRSAVKFCINVFELEWDFLKDIDNSKYQAAAARSLIHSTKSNQAKYPEFDILFYKYPCYLLTATINEAIGILNSYHSNLENYENSDKEGNPPRLQANHLIFPVFYRNNMSLYSDGSDTIQLKLFIDNDWKYMTFHLNCNDAVNIVKRAGEHRLSAPALEKKHKTWRLRFSFEDNQKLNNTPLKNRTILAVDLGINTCATCSVMKYDGTITARKFIDFPVEKDQLNHALNKIKKLQRRFGSHNVKKLWRIAKDKNDEIARKTVGELIRLAADMGADVIVFEHLDTKHKKSGTRKQRLQMWNHQYVQNLVTHKAHLLGIRISRICAKNTSRLAFDGSGLVLRGKNAGFNTYELCKFQSGKIYNCDLSASYNIGARYFIREIEKLYINESKLNSEIVKNNSKPADEKISLLSEMRAEVPGFQKRTQNTLKTLTAIHEYLAACA